MGSSLFVMQQYGVDAVWDGQFPLCNAAVRGGGSLGWAVASLQCSSTGWMQSGMGSCLFAMQQYGVEGVWDGQFPLYNAAVRGGGSLGWAVPSLQCSSTGWRESGVGSSLFAMQQYGVEGVWDGQFPLCNAAVRGGGSLGWAVPL